MYIRDIDLLLKDWEFAQRKNLPWELKLRLTKRRIGEWYDHWEGNVYISFSGGLANKGRAAYFVHSESTWRMSRTGSKD